MWISDNWRDYELLDCGGGERLERWGKYILVRPDPQAIWRPEGKHPGWRRYDARYQRSSTGGGKWVKKDLPERWTLPYRALTLNIKPMNFKHTGVFPEQAANWDFAMERIRAAGRPSACSTCLLHRRGLGGLRGGGGLGVPRGRGQGHGGLGPGERGLLRPVRRPHPLDRGRLRQVCGAGDRRGRKYDAVIMDPPSYGRGPSGEIWKLEENLFPFVELVTGVLSDEPLFFLINSYTTGLAPSVLTYLLETLVSRKYGGRTESQELGLPVTATGLALPCGATGRWTAE